jgi:hypothetical protein
MSEEQRWVAQHEVWAADLRALRRDLPIMQTCQAELAHSAGQLQVTQGTAARLYPWYGLNALAQLHAAILQALVNEQDFAAHTLAQNAIELAVDVMYVLEDSGGDRLTGALRHHLDAQAARFGAWQTAAPEQQEAGVRAAKLAADCRQSPWYEDAPAWPPLGTRADAVGFGAWVHPVLAGVANAEQTLAQELMNFLDCERGSPAKRQAAHAYRTARCASDALYTEVVALFLFAHALLRMASTLRDKVAITVAESAIDRLDDSLAEHHRLAEAQRDDSNVYLGVRMR